MALFVSSIQHPASSCWEWRVCQIWNSGARLHRPGRKATRFPFTHRDFPPHCASINTTLTACSLRQSHITMAPVRHLYRLLDTTASNLCLFPHLHTRASHPLSSCLHLPSDMIYQRRVRRGEEFSLAFRQSSTNDDEWRPNAASSVILTHHSPIITYHHLPSPTTPSQQTPSSFVSMQCTTVHRNLLRLLGHRC